MNFVQMLLGDAIRAKLRESRMKPFFDKLEAIYRIDPQVGALKDGVVTIPSAAHVKIALGNPDGTPLHTGYAAIGASARGGAFMSPRRDVTRLEVSEFARLILMSLPHLSDSRKDGAMSVGIDEIYGKFMEAETISRFGKLPDDQQTLHPHLS